MGRSRSCWNGTTSALQPEEITLKGTRVSIKVPIQKSLETYLMILVYIKYIGFGLVGSYGISTIVGNLMSNLIYIYIYIYIIVYIYIYIYK